MPADTPTPGQIAYAAFAVARRLEHELALWALLPPYMRDAWEAAAQAVRAAYKAEMAEAWQHGVLLWQAPPEEEEPHA